MSSDNEANVEFISESKGNSSKTTHSLNNSAVLDLNVDNLLSEFVGACGLWQWSTLIMIVLFSPLMTTFPVFVSVRPNHRCLMNETTEAVFKQANLTFEQISHLIGPSNSLDGLNYYSCDHYELDWTNQTLLKERINQYLRKPYTNTSLSTSSCFNGYVYKHTEYNYPDSIVAEFNLVCEKSWIPSIGTSMFMGGMIIGSTFGGLLGDKFGRRITIIMISIVEVIAAIGLSLSPNYYVYYFFRTLIGITNGGKTLLLHIIPIELTLAKYRSYFTSTIILGVTGIHRGLMSLEAYLIPNWRYLNITAMSPCFGIFIFLYFLPESPRWLCSQYKDTEALKVLQKGCRINCLFRKDQSKLAKLDEFIAQYNSMRSGNLNREPRKSKSFQGIHLKTVIYSIRKFVPNYTLLKNIVLTTILYTVQSSTVFGLLLYSRLIKHQIYVVTFINSIMSIPGPVLTSIIFRFTRYRRNPLIITFFFGSASLLFSGIYTLVFKPSSDIVLTVFTNFCFIMLSMTVIMLMIYFAELFPSDMRSFGVGFSTGFGRVGSMLSTFINIMDAKVGHGIPIIIYGILLFCQIIVLTCLKDTSGENLADHKEEVSNNKFQKKDQSSSDEFESAMDIVC